MVPFYLFNQCGSIQVKELGSFIFDPFGFFQRLQDQCFFKLGYGTVQTDTFI
jgi:hypothetical protein